MRLGERGGPHPGRSRSRGSVPVTTHGVNPGIVDAVDTGLLIAVVDDDGKAGGGDAGTGRRPAIRSQIVCLRSVPEGGWAIHHSRGQVNL